MAYLIIEAGAKDNDAVATYAETVRDVLQCHAGELLVVAPVSQVEALEVGSPSTPPSWPGSPA